MRSSIQRLLSLPCLLFGMTLQRNSRWAIYERSVFHFVIDDIERCRLLSRHLCRDSSGSYQGRRTAVSLSFWNIFSIAEFVARFRKVLIGGNGYVDPPEPAASDAASDALGHWCEQAGLPRQGVTALRRDTGNMVIRILFINICLY